MKDYYYFSTHTINQSIYTRLESGWEYSTLSVEDRELMDALVKNYPKGNFNESPLDYSSKFIRKHEEELYDLIKLKGSSLKYFFTQYLGFVNQWGASTRAFGKNSNKRAEGIPENELINEMTDPKGSIKKLLDSSHSNLSAVKPFLPAIMISLDTNTRNKSLMSFGHTGRFCFDFDGLQDSNEARVWMNKVWKGTKNIKPYMAFLSPRGKGFKVFCRVDTNNPDFVRDFGLEERAVVMKHHKVWYEGARKELVKSFPELDDKFDVSTNDPQRLTYLPFIDNPSINFKYSENTVSSYSTIINVQKESEQKDLLRKISKNSDAVEKIMKEQGITSKEDAYHLYLKSLSPEFDLELETDKFVKVVDHIESLIYKDDRVANWVYEKFNDYHTLHKMSWVLFGVFGDLAIEQIKRLIPEGSNKLDESNNDYRWAIRSKDDYDQDQLANLTPGAFYALVTQLGEVKDFVSDNYRVSSKNVSDFKMLNDYYETYTRNKALFDAEDDTANLNEFLDEVTNYLDKKKIRLPLIEELDSLTSEVKLGPSEYLDRETMKYIYQTKYSDKRIFCLRSQCGTGKNTIAGNPQYKLKGRVILAEPFKSISDQAASEAWENGDRDDQLFVNSGVENTLRSFKTTDEESIRVNYETTLKGTTLPSSSELVIHSTYNQILNLSHSDLSTFDYIFIDEAHTLSDGLSYRSEVIANLIHYLVEFVARKRDGKTKIIFMSGTPNVETHVIPELMEDYKVKSLFQRIIVDKEYKIKPTIHLTHLDVKDKSVRQDMVISQINAYIRQGRKVCHIFNNKAKMDQYIREIQTKLSNKIKVGLFYSGSTGECTRNILSGKIGDYDVILATTYFINGINIEKDLLSLVEIAEGKTSNQKYGVVIDLGQGHTRVNAMDAIQAINRFRNRKVHSTIFLPQIFKPDLKNKSRGFQFGNAAKVLLGINKYNHHLLSREPDLVEFEDDEVEVAEKLFLLKEIRLNPITVSTRDITKASLEEENRSKVVDMISKKTRLYEDWFCSLDGYHYLAEDAGFRSIIKHTSVESSLIGMTEEHLALENKVVENFLANDKALRYLDNQIDPDKRIFVKSSGKITDPEDTTVKNFVAVDLLNDKYVIEGDFHISHERSVNQLINAHLKLSYWYGVETAMEIFRFILNPEVTLMPSQDKHHSSNISRYLTGCKNASMPSMSLAYSYVKGLEILSNKDLGVTKFETPTSVSYTIDDPKVVDSIMDSWADVQYESTMYKINTSDSEEKEELKSYYSNRALVKDYDVSELRLSLPYIGQYSSYKLSRYKNKTISSPEQLHIPKVLRSPKLLKANLNEDTSDWQRPRTHTLKEYREELEDYSATIESEAIKVFKNIKSKYPDVGFIFTSEVMPHILNRKYEVAALNLSEAALKVTPEMKEKLKLSNKLSRLEFTLYDKSRVYKKAFQASEFLLHQEYIMFNRLPSFDKLFFCDSSFELESLLETPEIVRTEVQNDNFLKLLKASYKKSEIKKGTKFWVASDLNGDVVVVEKLKKSFCKSLCDYAFKYKPFVTPSGSPVKEYNKGIYNSETFSRDYINNSNPTMQINNYILQRLLVKKDFYNEELIKQ
jgi:hypothetical protein